jgi:prohibitin 2
MKSSLILCTLFLFTSCGFEVVDTGHRGVLTNYGKVVGEPLPEGLQFYNPFSEDLVELSVRETSQAYQLAAYSKDNQQITAVVTVTSAPIASKVHLIFREFGEDYFNQIARPSITAAVKDILGQYTADNIIAERGKMQAQAKTYVYEKLAPRFINVTAVEFTDIKFQSEYEQAVEAKVVAIQRAEEAKNKTEEVKEEKEQTILKAQAEAESIKIKSAALQQNAKLVELEAIQKWDGKLPTQIFGNGAMPFINVK